MASVYANKETALELELRRLKSALSDVETKLKKSESDLEGSSKVKEAQEKAEDKLKTCFSQNCKLEERVTNLEANTSPLEDKPEDLKRMKTRAELVHCYQVVVDDGLVNVVATFENVIAPLRILNPRVNLRTEGCNFAYTVADGQMVIRDYLQDSMIMDDSLATMAENPGLEDMVQQGLGGAEQRGHADPPISEEPQQSTQWIFQFLPDLRAISL